MTFVGCASRTSIGVVKVKRKPTYRNSKEFSAADGRGELLAAQVGRKTARMHGTQIYLWKNGKVVAEKP